MKIPVSGYQGRPCAYDEFLISDPLPEIKVLKEEYKKNFKKSLPVKYELKSWEMIKSMIKSGLGVGLLPDFMLSDKNLFKIEAPFDFLDYNLGLLTRPGVSQYSQSVRQYLDVFEEAFSQGKE